MNGIHKYERHNTNQNLKHTVLVPTLEATLDRRTYVEREREREREREKDVDVDVDIDIDIDISDQTMWLGSQCDAYTGTMCEQKTTS